MSDVKPIRSGNDIFVTAQDGLRLHVREHGSRTSPALPVVCLPGLARTVADFEELARLLSGGPQARRVIAIDARGRGRSDYDHNPENYNVAVELGDVVTVLTALGIGPAVFIGSSRGGILTMLLGVAHPTLIAGAILHDIGPVIEPKGVARIKSYVGKLPQPRDYTEGAEVLRRLFDAQFPRLTAEHWLAAARNTWKSEDGALVPTYDVRLDRTLAEVDIERPLPTMWNEFDALARVPVLVIRGANSDIFPPQRSPKCASTTRRWKLSRWPIRATCPCSIRTRCLPSSPSSPNATRRSGARRGRAKADGFCDALSAGLRPTNHGNTLNNIAYFSPRGVLERLRAPKEDLSYERSPRMRPACRPCAGSHFMPQRGTPPFHDDRTRSANPERRCPAKSRPPCRGGKNLQPRSPAGPR